MKMKKIVSKLEKYVSEGYNDDIDKEGIKFAEEIDDSKFKTESEGNEKHRRTRPRIEEMFTKEIREKLYLNSVNYKIPKRSERAQVVRDLLEPEFTHLGTGTNRITFLKDGYAVKIALDRRGLIDNYSEYKRSIEAPQFLAKAYETNRTILIAEYVNLIDRQEFMDNIDKLKYILECLTQVYIIDDLGLTAKNYCNWGYRDDKSIVALDYAYMYPIQGNEEALKCSCGGHIVPDKNFTAYVCDNPSCKMKYSTMEIKSRIRMDLLDQDDAEIIEVLGKDPSEKKFIRVAGENITEVNEADINKESEIDPNLDLDILVDKVFNLVVTQNKLVSNAKLSELVKEKLHHIGVFDKLLSKYETLNEKDLHFTIKDKVNGKKVLTVTSIISDYMEEFETDDRVDLSDVSPTQMTSKGDVSSFLSRMNSVDITDGDVNIGDSESESVSDKLLKELSDLSPEEQMVTQQEWENLTSLYDAMKNSKNLLSDDTDDD